MKYFIIPLLLLLTSSIAFSQDPPREYFERNTPAVKQQKLKEIIYLCEITPGLWRKLALPYTDRLELDKRMKTDYALGYYYAPDFYNHGQLIDYILVEISGHVGGKLKKAHSNSDELSMEQKFILSNIDPGTDFDIKIKFSYKQNGSETPVDNTLLEGRITLTAVPETEAEFPGGLKQMGLFLNHHVLNKVTSLKALEKLHTIVVKFIVNEDGQLTDIRITKSSNDAYLDKLVLDAIGKMPNWKPAQNNKGLKIMQEFTIPFGGDGC